MLDFRIIFRKEKETKDKRHFKQLEKIEKKADSCYSCYSRLKIFMKIEPGESVILILQNPREKLVGVLHEINAAGIFLRGIDLGYFDEWISAIKNGEPYLPMQDYFVPMWRVERLTRDESSPEMLSMTEQFNQKTGFDLSQF